MPLGGYKGSGLAMMVEILCAVLGGGAMANDVGGIRIARPGHALQPDVHGHRCGALHAGGGVHRQHGTLVRTSSRPRRRRRATMRSWWRAIPEWRTEAERLHNGIPLAEGNWETLCRTAARPR